jgi:hypothetical protein
MIYFEVPSLNTYKDRQLKSSVTTNGIRIEYFRVIRWKITKFWKAVGLLSPNKTASNPTYIRNGYFLYKNLECCLPLHHSAWCFQKIFFIIYNWTEKNNEKFALDNMHCQWFESVSFRVQDGCSVTESTWFLFTSVQVINTIRYELLCWPALWSSGQSPWLQKEMYCVSCEVRTEFIYIM